MFCRPGGRPGIAAGGAVPATAGTTLHAFGLHPHVSSNAGCQLGGACLGGGARQSTNTEEAITSLKNPHLRAAFTGGLPNLQIAKL